MISRCFRLALIAAWVLPAFTQTPPNSAAPPEQPLSAIPYTPSLDLNSMDRSVDPCVDFYKYTCGGWMKSNPTPPDQAGWDVYAKLAHENGQFLWGILEQDAKLTNRTPAQQKVGDYFAACMNTSAIDKLGLKPLQPELDRIAAITDRKQLAEFLREGADRQGLYFFGAGSEQDAKNAEMVIVRLGAGGLGLPDRDYYTKADSRSEEIRKRYVAYLAQLLVMAGEPQATADGQAASTMKIETALAKASLTRVERRDPYNVYHPMKIEEVETLTPALEIGAYLKGESLPESSLDKINMSQPKFFEALQTELANEPVENLKSYLRTHALSAAAPSLSTDFETAQFDFFSKYLRGVPQMQPRWQRCERQVDRYLGEALGQEFVARNLRRRHQGQSSHHDRPDRDRHAAGDRNQLDWMS